MAKKKILVVEDEIIVAKDLENILKGMGYDVVAIASSGEEAVSKAKTTRPDLVLMDIMLRGGRDGVETTQRIQSFLDVPVIYLTAYADDKILERAKITGPLGYLIKPFRERELHSTIEIALYKHDMEKRLKESNEEQRRLEQQLFQAQKMESLGLLVGGIAHDFNNLLTVILGNTDLLLLEVGELNPSREIITEVKKAAERGAALTNRLLAFGRRQPLHPVMVNLADLISNLTRMLRRIIGEHIELRINISKDVSNVLADPTALEQVIMNLALNARAAMPEGGVLAIEAQDTDLDEAFCRRFPFTKPGRYVRLTTVDTGTGMEEAVLHRIFDPFFTTKQGGTGLGLSVVYGIVKQHKGYIIPFSKPGHGSRFEIYLPLASGIPTNHIREIPRQVLPRGTETILVAEDEDAVGNLFRTFLESLGYKVLLVPDGEAAWEIYVKRWPEIDLIISDAVMPRMGGVKLYQRIRHVHANTPFLLVSGYSEEMNQRDLPGGVSIPLMRKPVDFSELSKKVRELLSNRPSLTGKPSPLGAQGGPVASN